MTPAVSPLAADFDITTSPEFQAGMAAAQSAPALPPELHGAVSEAHGPMLAELMARQEQDRTKGEAGAA